MPAKFDLHDPRHRDDANPWHRRLAAALDVLALVCGSAGRASLPARLFDRFDDRLAVARRAAFGRRRWLLSWHRRPDGSWLARLSGPGEGRTVERSARTRSCAILRAARASGRIREFHDRTRTLPGLDPDSQHANTP